MEYDPQFEQDISCTTPEELGAFLCEPHIAAEVYRANAVGLAQRVRAYMHTDVEAEDEHQTHEPVASIDEDSFSRLYDPTLPTIAFDHNYTFSGTELIGLAARQTGAANIVYTPGGTPSLELVTDVRGTTLLQATAGIMLDAHGTAHYGEFPSPVTVDVFDTTDDALLRDCSFYGVRTLNSFETMRHCDAKADLENIVQGSGVAMPQRYTPDMLASDAASREDIVVKPASASQGTGVRIFEAKDVPVKACEYFAFLDSYGYEPIIEERIKSYPLHDPQTGNRLDWNVRALVAHGTLVDMYVRASDWGGPVNKSLGARSLQLEQLETYGVDAQQAEIIRARLAEAARAMAEHIPDIAIGGLDITVDESLQPVLFELNIGNTGGLQTLAVLETSPHAKLANAQRLLDIWEPKLAKVHGDVEQTRRPVDWSFDALALAAHYADKAQMLAGIPLELVRDRTAKSHTFARWAFETHARTILYDQRLAIEQEMCRRFPLEAVAELHVLMPNAADPAALVAHIKQVEAYMPPKPEWRLLRGLMYSQLQDFATMRQELIAAQNSGATQEDLTATYKAVAANLLNKVGVVDRSTEAETYAAQTKAIVSLVETFCRYDFAMTTLVAHHLTTLSEEDPALQSAVRDSMFHMALSLDESTYANELYNKAKQQDEDAIFYYAEVISEHKDQLIKSPEGAALLLRVEMESDLAMTAILDYVRSVKSQPDMSLALQKTLAQNIASHIAKDAAPEEHDQFADFLVSYAHNNYQEKLQNILLENLPAAERPTLSHVAHMLVGLEARDGAAVSIAVQRLAERTTIVDLDVLASAMADDLTLRDLAKSDEL